MREFKGTKGEWKNTVNIVRSYVDGSPTLVCECKSYKDSDNHSQERLANAKLIAAAPDLLEAAKIGLECLREIGEHQDGWEKDLEKVEKAINKAL